MKKNFYTQTFARGACIYSEGDQGDVAYVVQTGMVEMTTLQGGEQTRLAVLTKGQMLGENSLIDDVSRSATATALEDTVLTVISREQFEERLNGTEPMIRMLLRIFIARYRLSLSSASGVEKSNPHNAPLPRDTVSEKTQALAIGKFTLETELRDALFNEELLVHYQPLLDLKTGKWAGFEALIRWNHPTRGYIPALEFITLAEETSLIIPVGLYVLKRACEGLVSLQEERSKVMTDAPPLFIGVNISSKQLADNDFIERIVDIVEQTGTQPSNIKLEITESMTVDYRQVVKWVKRCKDLGFSLAIDDFGTGYSSMEHLLEMDIDTLKIDQAFIKKMHQQDKARNLVQGIVDLSKALDYSIVAEGIETQLDADTVRDMGVHYGQGFYIGKPQPLGEILQQIKDGA